MPVAASLSGLHSNESTGLVKLTGIGAREEFASLAFQLPLFSRALGIESSAITKPTKTTACAGISTSRWKAGCT